MRQALGSWLACDWCAEPAASLARGLDFHGVASKRTAQSILGRFLPGSLALSLALHAVALALAAWLLGSSGGRREIFAREYSLEMAAVPMDPQSFPEPAPQETLILEQLEPEIEQLLSAEPEAQPVLFPETQLEFTRAADQALRGAYRQRIERLEYTPKQELLPASAPESAPQLPSPDGDWSPPIPDAPKLHQAPRILTEIAPEYPRMSQRLGESGQVVLEISVDSRGRATDARVVKSSGYERLDQAARSAVLTWTYAPASDDGLAIAGTLRHSVLFAFQE